MAGDPTLVCELPCTHFFLHAYVSEVACMAAGAETGSKFSNIQLYMLADECFYPEGPFSLLALNCGCTVSCYFLC